MQTRSQVAKIRESIREFGFINPVLLDENLGIIAGHGRVASSEMTQAEFTEFLTTFMRQAKEYYVDGALHYLFMDWKHVGEISAAGAAVYDDFKNICIWNETKNDVLTISDNNHLILKAFATAWKHREIYEECGDVDTVARKVGSTPRTIYRYLDVAYMNPELVNNILSAKKIYSLKEIFAIALRQHLSYNQYNSI